jgi:hypothetical protein
LNTLFVKKDKYWVKKLESPVAFDYYQYMVKRYVLSFNQNCDLLFLQKKYNDYLCKFANFELHKDHRFIIRLDKDLNIFSKNNTDLRFYIDRGWSEDEAKIKLKDRQTTIYGSANFRKTATPTELSERKNSNIDKQNKSRKNNEQFQQYLKTVFASNPNYWTSRINPQTNELYTESEATELARYHKKINSKKGAATKRIRDSFNSCRSVKGWLNRGFSIEVALAEVHRVQTINTLTRYVEKYGSDVGPIKFKDRQDKRLITLSKKTDEEKLDLLIRQTGGFKRYSNASFVFFKNFIIYLQTTLGIIDLTYMYGPIESFIYDTERKKISFYDFYIKELNFYIEFNGIKYHPNKNKLTEIEWANWKNPFSGILADEQYAIDQYKQQLIINKGGELHVFWEQDCVSETYIRLGNIILDKYNLYKNNKINGN